MAELILESRVIITWLLVLKTLIWRSPMIKISELLLVGNLRSEIWVVI